MKIPSQILMTSDTVSGVWPYTMELCAYFERQGIEVILAVTGEPASVSQKKEISEFKNVVYHEKNYKLEWMDDPWTDIKRSGEWLLNLEHKYRPDIIHLNSYSYGSLHWQSPVMIAGHTDKLSWWKSVKSEPIPQEWSKYYMHVYNGLHAADFVVAPSRFLMQTLNIIYGDFLNQSVIYKGRDKRKFNVSSHKENIIASASLIWDEAKNIKAITEAAPGFNWKVEAAGSVSPVNDGEAGKNNINYLGKIPFEETANLFSRASIFVLPAKYEPFGLTALEAALSGCALVLGKTASQLEIWDEAALFVTPGDVEELIFIVNYLISHHDLIKNYAVRAHKRGIHLSSIKMGQEYLSLYRRIIKNITQKHKAVV